jgi:hypothetical protein
MNSLDDHVRGLAIDYADSHDSATVLLIGRRRTLEQRIAETESALTETERRLKEVHYEMYVGKPELKDTFLPAQDQLQQNVVHLRGVLADLQVKLEKHGERQLVLMRAGSEPWSRQRPIEEQRAWIRQYVRRVTIAPAEVRGAKFDSRRIQIDWMFGEIDLPPACIDEADHEAWNTFINTPASANLFPT